jgi:hypothetical protein
MQLTTDGFVFLESVGCIVGTRIVILCRTHGATYSVGLKLLKIKIKTINFSLDVSSLVKHWVIYFNNGNLLSLLHSL